MGKLKKPGTKKNISGKYMGLQSYFWEIYGTTIDFIGQLPV
jgi:hypothetical protein